MLVSIEDENKFKCFPICFSNILKYRDCLFFVTCSFSIDRYILCFIEFPNIECSTYGKKASKFRI